MAIGYTPACKLQLEDRSIRFDQSENLCKLSVTPSQLIDMDLGKELNSVPSGASHRTGTMQFMAIEVL